MDRIVQDVRVALRGFRRTPTFAISVVAILGLGIGMTVAMVTVVEAVLLRSLPVRDERSLAVMWTYHDPSVELSNDLETLDRMRPETRTMRDIAGVAHFGANTLPWVDGTRPRELRQSTVTSNFFDVLGVHAVLGRLLRPDDDRKGAEPVLVISYATWQSQFGGDSAIVGHRITSALEELSFRIVGVAPAGLDYPLTTDFWRPAGTTNGAMLAIVRIAPDATIAAARAEFFSLSKQLNPTGAVFVGAKAIPFAEAVVGNVRPALVALTVAVALLLVIACVNVGNLLLLRAASRTREFAIRRALGASLSGIVGLMLTESALLASAGGLVGLVAAQSLLRVLVTFAPTRLPNEELIQLAGTPIAIAVGVTLVAMLVFGVTPAIIASAASESTSLRLGARSGGETVRRSNLRRLLVVSQMALAVVMLASAGLVVRSLSVLQRVNLGFQANHLSVLGLSLPISKYDWDGPKMHALAEQLESRWRAIPGVESVTPIVVEPFLGASVFQGTVEIEERPQPNLTLRPWVPMEEGGPEYFRTLGIPLLRGRGFEESDRENSLPVAIVSEEIARRYWPGENPVGKHIRFWGLAWRTVVGVAGDVRWRSLRDATPTIYLPWRQGLWRGGFALRTRGPFASTLLAIRQATRNIDPQLDLWRTRTLDEELAGPLAQPRLNAFLLSGFALVALILAAIGLYGVMASSVRDRTREIGVRMALGASPARVSGDVLRQAGITFGVGAVVGLLGAVAMSRLLTALSYQVSPTDPLTLLGACGVLLLVALGAAYIPARRATRVDPAQALRAD